VQVYRSCRAAAAVECFDFLGQVTLDRQVWDGWMNCRDINNPSFLGLPRGRRVGSMLLFRFYRFCRPPPDCSSFAKAFSERKKGEIVWQSHKGAES
jgi:hypothetical protein